MRLLLPLILALLGAGAGIAAGLFLAPAPPVPSAADAAPEAAQAAGEEAAGGDGMAALEAAAGNGEEPARPDIAEIDFVRLNNQFIVPVL
jgi:hypothetical protein